MNILEFLGLGTSRPRRTADDAPETVRRIVGELDHLDPERARFVAAFAFVLSRVAGADLRISDAETRVMETIVAEHGGLPEEQAVIVVQMAKHQNVLFGGTENFLVTRELNRLATRDQKLRLLECLFAVSAADETITTVENGAVRQIASELKLDHADFIAAKTRFREHLAVLRSPDGATDQEG